MGMKQARGETITNSTQINYRWIKDSILKEGAKRVLNIPLEALQTADIIELLNSIQASKKETINQSYFITVLKVFISTAEKHYNIEAKKNLFLGLKPKRNTENRRDSLPDDIINKLFNDFETYKPFEDKQQFVIFFTLLSTGIRAGELVALTRNDIDEKNRRLNIDKNLTKSLEKGKLSYSNTKNHKPRIVPVSLTLLALLKSLPENGRFLFSTPKGESLNNEILNRWFKKALLKTGLDETTIKKRKYTVHCLRHTGNTIQLQAGTSPELLRSAYGWSDSQIQQTYSHIKAEQATIIADTIDRRFIMNAHTDDTLTLAEPESTEHLQNRLLTAELMLEQKNAEIEKLSKIKEKAKRAIEHYKQADFEQYFFELIESVETH